MLVYIVQSSVCALNSVCFCFVEQKKAREEDDAAWQFFESLLESHDEVDALPPALSNQNAAYAALSAQQKEYFHNELLPRLLERKDDLTAADGKNGAFGIYNAATWMRILCALSSVEFARRSHVNDCLHSTHAAKRQIAAAKHIHVTLVRLVA